MKITLILYWIARGIAALIILQTLYFKFTGAEESVYIFSTLGMEPWGRIGVGVMELISSLLMLTNRTAWIGAALAIGLMLGAVGMHLLFLGISIMDDGGYLFILACVVTVCSSYVLWCDRVRVEGFLQQLLQRVRQGT